MENIDEYGVNKDRPDYEEIKAEMDKYYEPYNKLGEALRDFLFQLCKVFRIPEIVRWLNK